MAYSRDAFIKDYRETRERLERDGAMADGLTYTNKIAREKERARKIDETIANGWPNID